MGLPKIIFNIATSGLGLLAANIQKTPGLVLTGVTVSGKINLGTSHQLFSLQDAVDLGITETENPFAYKHVKAFYDYAGAGELWIMLVSDATTMENMADSTMAYAKKLLNDAAGAIRILGIVKKSLGTETSLNGLDADVDKAVIKAQALAEEFEDNYFPLRVLISANNFGGTVSALKDYKTTTHNKVALLLANTDGEKEAAIGLALGRLASTPVQRNIGRVKDGPVEDTAAYFTNGAKVESLTNAWEAIHNKGYIILRSFAGRSGFFFSDDPTLTKDTDDFHILSNGFVMDKALMIAYDALVENLGDEVPVTDEGTIHPAIIKSWQNDVETQLDGLMVQTGELSNAKVYIDEKQNVLSSGNMNVTIQLLPVGYAKQITVNIGFTTQIN
ncbi:DUF2586 family protein [Chryseobacterium sp. TY4]